MSAEDQVIDVRTAAEASDLLKELPNLRVDDSHDDEPVLIRAASPCSRTANGLLKGV